MAWTSQLEDKAQAETIRRRNSDSLLILPGPPKSSLQFRPQFSEKRQANQPAGWSPFLQCLPAFSPPLLTLARNWLLGFHSPGSSCHVLGIYSCTSHYRFDFKKKADMLWIIPQPYTE